MASLAEILKEEENAQRVGWDGSAWFPHKSFEGKEDTIGYGHKLSAEEHAGRYVELPDGTVVDFDDRGLTEDEALALFQQDVSKKQNVAQANWNTFVSKDYQNLANNLKRKYTEEEWGQLQGKSFDQLDPMQQSLLTEISFNVGSLKNSGGKFGWPSLAKAISENDVEGMKKEIMRSAVNANTGKKEKLTKRVNSIRKVVDQFYQRPEDVDLAGFTTKAQADVANQTQTSSSFEGITEAAQTVAETSPADILTSLAQSLNKLLETPQRGSQTPSRGDTEAQPTESEDAAQSRWTETEEALINAAVKAEAPAAEEAVSEEDTKEEKAWTPLEEQLIQRATGTVETEEPVHVEDEGEEFGDKDPIFGIF